MASRERSSGKCRPGRVAIAASALRPFETGEGRCRVDRVVEGFDQRLTRCPYAAPRADKRGAAEEGRLHGELIEAPHVPVEVDAMQADRVRHERRHEESLARL